MRKENVGWKFTGLCAYVYWRTLSINLISDNSHIIGHVALQCERAIFTLSHSSHHSTDPHQIWHILLPRRYQIACQVSSWLVQLFRLGDGVKYTLLRFPVFSPRNPTSTRRHWLMLIINYSTDQIRCLVLFRTINFTEKWLLGGFDPPKPQFCQNRFFVTYDFELT